MQEYTARAVILHKEPSRELDLRVTMFTDEFGKVSAKAKSARKITSKLSAHLEPGNFSFVRFIEKGGLQLTDAFKLGKLQLTPHDLHVLDRLLPHEEQDPNLWQALRAFAETTETPQWNWAEVLTLLGWDPTETSCEKCHSRKPAYFMLPSQSLYCAECARASRIPQDAVLYIGNDGRKHAEGS